MDKYFQPAKAFIVLFSLSLLTIPAGCGGDVGVGSAGAAGTATLQWESPTTTPDGVPLTGLAGYKIYYGTSSGDYTAVIDAGNVTTHTVGNLPPGTYYFAVTAYDGSGNESDYSNEAGKIIP